MKILHPLLRTLAGLVLVVQVGLPVGAALADEPVVPVVHQTHVSAEAGCEPVHDHLECLVCRTLVAPAEPTPVPGPAPAVPAARTSRVVVMGAPGGDLLPALNPARAPPVS